MTGTARVVSLVVAGAMVALPALAGADPWKDESGHGRGGKGGYKYEEKYDRGGHVKREWKSGDCSYEYKAGPGSVKEEYKCDGHGPYAAWIPPGHRGRGYASGYPDIPLDLGLGRCSREMIGQILGGAAGAAAGSQIGGGNGRLVAIAGGTILGVLLGGEIGRSMDQTDHLCVDQAFEHAPDGQPIIWNDAGGAGARQVTPVETFQTNDGRYCREYTAQSTVGGRQVQTYGTACRQPDGSWQIVS